MKFLLLFVLSGLTAYFMGPYLPHWGLMLAISVLAAIVGGKGAPAFFSAALAVGLDWFLIPIFVILQTGSDIPDKIARIMGLDHVFFLMGITSLMGFMIGGLGGFMGNRFHRLFQRDKNAY